MNYSILLLGASISIALFIRICCALEADVSHEDIDKVIQSVISTSKLNYDEAIQKLSSGRANEVYEKFLKYNLIYNAAKAKGSGSAQNLIELGSRLNAVADEWIDEMRLNKLQHPKLSTPVTDFPTAKLLDNTKLFGEDEDICGFKKPPPQVQLPLHPDWPDCNRPRDMVETPAGCEYINSSMTKYFCGEDSNIENVPILPYKLDTLELHQTSINDISIYEFCKASIGSIRLSQNRNLTFIDPWGFHNVDSLTSLFINGNPIKYLSYGIYGGLQNTTMLDVSGNLIDYTVFKTCPIKEEEDIVSVMPELRMLRLSDNPLKIIPKQIFGGLWKSKNLKTLYLDNCYLEEIDKDAFKFLPYLEILNLAGNPGIQKYLKASLSKLHKLKSLYLSDVGLTRFPTEELSDVSNQLTVLDLSGNFFNSINWSDLSFFPNLTELFLDDCKILTIDNNAFSSNSRLVRLSLQNNKLRDIPLYFPLTLSQLHITADGSTWTQLDFQSFQNLPRLRTLELSGIRFKGVLDKDSFGSCNLTSLATLMLTSWNIERIDDNAFVGLKNLRTLHLNNTLTPISSISSDAFVGLDKLSTLMIVNCRVSFPSDPDFPSPFRHLESLTRLNLERNQITHVPDLSDLTNLGYLFLSNNPMESWKNRLFPNRNSTVFDIQTDGGEIETFHVTLTNGNFQFLTDAMIEDFERMNQIDISGNKILCDNRTCQLRDMIIRSKHTPFQNWTNSENYRCSDRVSEIYYHIYNISDEVCARAILFTTPSPDTSEFQDFLPTSQNGVIKIIAISTSLTVLIAVVIILAYRNRVHLRYFFFVAKFNVMPVAPRKAKTSTMEEWESTSPNDFDYDVFISYHHDDSAFIEEEFLPEIELQESKLERADSRESIYEAKNFVYIIENENIVQNGKAKMEFQKKNKFKVCLHERDFTAGVPITENIVDCVDRSRKTIIFVSNKYMRSQWCSFELNLTYHRMVESRRKSFVLVILEEIPTDMRSKVLNYLMVSKTHLQWPGMNGSREEKAHFWRKLRHFLQTA